MMDEMSPADQAEFESVFEEIEREFEAEMGGDLEMDPMIETDVVNKVTE